jgi:hypothetical protein
MRQAILTRYLGPTNTKGSRVRATAQAGSVTIAWNDEADTDANHRIAAEFLASMYGWLRKNRLEGGALPDGKSYAFVLIELPKEAQTEVNRCERCGEDLAPGRETWLTYDQRYQAYTDQEVPMEYDQGGFSFGDACARKELARYERVRKGAEPVSRRQMKAGRGVATRE